MPTISGSQFAKSLDPKPGLTRRGQILDAIKNDLHVPIIWTEISTQWRGHTAVFFVPLDVIRIGNLKDALRVSMPAQDLDRIASYFGAILPTFHLLREAYKTGIAQGLRITPATQPGDSSMRNTDRMVRHSKEVDARIDGRVALAAPNAGKHWVLDNNSIGKLAEGQPMAVNAGWWRSADENDLWQSPGFHHGVEYDDYSQCAWFVRRDTIVDGQVMDIEEVARDPGLCGLVTGSATPLKVFSVPGSDQPWPTIERSITPPPDTSPTVRDLKIGMEGEDVAVWQRQLMKDGKDLSPWNDDGDFGRLTHNMTVSWQADRVRATAGEVGVVGPKTRAAIGSPPDRGDTERPFGLELIQAANYTKASRGEVRWIVIHTMEAAEASTTARAVARWFGGLSGTAPRASAHYCIDDSHAIRCVESYDVAWHAPGANRYGIGIEHAGYARQTAEQWADPYSDRMLRISAKVAADECQRWGIPVRYVDRAGLLAGERGISTHNEVTWAFRQSTHTDPGKFFPMEHYLDLVREEIGKL